MTVIDFNLEKGLYVFQLDDFETHLHSHPTIEVLLAEKGKFSLSTKDSAHNELTFAVIDCNILHKIVAKDCQLKIVMIEHNTSFVYKTLSHYNISLRDSLYLQDDYTNMQPTVDELIHQIVHLNIDCDYDKRVRSIIGYLNNQDLNYEAMMQTLKKAVNLSESRISHLFKQNVGLSLKRYLVWCKLKKTIIRHLQNKEDLFSSLINNGFYDQPHFSKAFKIMLGVKPSKAYNSRMLQVFPPPPL